MENAATFIERLNLAVAQREGELGMRILKKDLAAAAEVSSSAVTLWYKGDTLDLKAASIFGLASYLKVRAEWLYGNSGPMRRELGRNPVHEHREPVDVVSRDAGELIEMIRSADKAGAASKETLRAMKTLLGQIVGSQDAPIDLTGARSIRRAEQLVESHQPKVKRGKGAA
jgi:hypothetical protein